MVQQWRGLRGGRCGTWRMNILWNASDKGLFAAQHTNEQENGKAKEGIEVWQSNMESHDDTGSAPT